MRSLLVGCFLLGAVSIGLNAYLLVRSDRRGDRLYRASRIYIVAADSLETRLRWAEGRYSQCAAYF